jgi:hypothetical protein
VSGFTIASTTFASDQIGADVLIDSPKLMEKAGKLIVAESRLPNPVPVIEAGYSRQARLQGKGDATRARRKRTHVAADCKEIVVAFFKFAKEELRFGNFVINMTA